MEDLSEELCALWTAANVHSLIMNGEPMVDYIRIDKNTGIPELPETNEEIIGAVIIYLNDSV